MSRIGKAIIEIPEGVEINISEDNIVSVKGKLGELSQKIYADLEVSITEGILEVKRPSDSKVHKAQHGLSRALIANMVIGVTEELSLPEPSEVKKLMTQMEQLLTVIEPKSSRKSKKS